MRRLNIPLNNPCQTALPRSGNSEYFPLSRVLAWPGYVLFFLMLFVPTTYQEIKAFLAILVLGTILAHGFLAVHRAVVSWTFIMVTTGMWFIFLGMLEQAPGAPRVGTVYVLWPLVYLVYVAGAAKRSVIEGLLKVLVFAAVAIGLYTLSYIGYATGRLPEFLYVVLDQGQGISFSHGLMEYNLYSINSLLFLVPFLFGALLVWHDGTALPVSRKWLWLAFMLGAILTILSGRRVLWVICAMAPAIAFALRMLLPRPFRRSKFRLTGRTIVAMLAIILVGYLLLHYFYELDIQAMSGYLTAGFDLWGSGGREASATIRGEVVSALLEGWLQHPLLGSGHGAALPGLIRSEDQPWAYELSYLALLYQVGLVGFLIYFAGVVWTYWMGIEIIRSGHRLGFYMLPVLTGTTCFLVANTTNPYLAKYDYLWVVFLPIAIINRWLLDKTSTMKAGGESLPLNETALASQAPDKSGSVAEQSASPS